MDGWKQWFLLLLPLCVHADSKETVVKTIRREPDITPVCMSENLGMLVFVSCRISTKGDWREDCHLLYMTDKQFDRECDSRFTLINVNETIFIHLVDLTPVDSGNYTCECSYERGTHVTLLEMTVEADEDGKTFSSMKFIILIIGAALLIIAGIICGHILRRYYHRGNTRSGTSELTRSGIPRVLDHDHFYASFEQPDGDYQTLRWPSSDIYQTISSSYPHHDAEVDSANIYAVITQEMGGKEKDLHSVDTIYETI